METEIDIINSILYTVEKIPVCTFIDCERKLGIESGLKTLKKHLIEASEKKEAEADG